MKLLQKTIRSYFIYSLVILLVAIPVFYFVIQGIVREDIDENLLNKKELFKSKIKVALLNNSVEQLKFFDNDISVSASSSVREFDTLTTVEIFDTIAKELVPYRLLASHFAIDGKLYVLKIKISLVDNDDLIESIVKVQVILLILLLTGLFVINRNLSKKIWMPFYITLQQLRNYKVEKHEPLSLSKTSITELNDLNASLQELTERTHKSYLNQKEFTENAAHEMQTPVAVLQGKLELLMQTVPITEQQAQLIGELYDAGNRMAKLNKSLVLLTSIENSQFAEKETVSVKHCVEKFILLYQAQIKEKQVIIENKMDEDVVLCANNALIEILISNLTGNAIRHNYIGGRIIIQLYKDSLSIQNTGRLAALNEDKIFQRFHKESADANSTGLGLEMVKKVCNINHYTISYRFTDNMHVFTIDFTMPKN